MADELVLQIRCSYPSIFTALQTVVIADFYHYFLTKRSCLKAVFSFDFVTSRLFECYFSNHSAFFVQEIFALILVGIAFLLWSIVA